MVIILGCGSVFGVVILLYFVFFGMWMRFELMEGLIFGVVGDVIESGWLNFVIFFQYLQSYFVYYVFGGFDELVLLLIDGYRFYVLVVVVEWVKEYNIVLYVLLVYISYIFQFMDVGCYGFLQKIYNNLCY